MELERDFMKFYGEFQEETAKLQANLNFLNDMRKSIDEAIDWLKNDKSKWVLTFQAVQQLQNIMKRFNDDADKIFDEFDKNGNDGNGCSIDMQQRLDGGKCQITHIVDSKKCICYAVDLNGATVSRLKTFWKEAPFLHLQPIDDEDSALNDIFGIELKSKLNRAKFMFDSTMNSVRIRLIDTGEIIEHGQLNLQKLPNGIKSLPAAAFQCKINQIGNVTVQSLSDSLKGQIFDYQIRKNVEINDMFCIDVRPTNPFLMETTGIDTDVQTLNIVDAYDDPFACNDINSDVDDDNANLEQTMNKTFQRKWDDEGKSSKKILNTNSIYSSNHNLSDSTLNDFQSVNNRNGAASMGGQINHGFACVWDNDWGNGDGGSGAAGGADAATSIAIDQQSMIQSDEKSISIRNRCDGAIALNERFTRYNRQMGNRSSMHSSNTNNNWSAAGRPWPNDRQHHSSNSLFESVRPMKTQCETTVVLSNHRKLKNLCVGEPITIIPTYVLNAREFYGQLGAYFNALQYSQQRLNYRRLYFQNEPYSQMPGEGELVLALLENGSFYRARVLAPTNNHEILVFLLDYGTTHKIDLRFIYKWTRNCNEFPFYSVLFSLGNVRHNNGSSIDASVFDFVKSRIPKTFTSAEVIAVDDHSISVRIFDDTGFDIGDEINCMINK